MNARMTAGKQITLPDDVVEHPEVIQAYLGKPQTSAE